MDEAQFDEFYSASFRRITGQVYAMTGDLDEAQECVQEAFARAWSHRRSLDRAQHPEAWVRTTARRIAISRWRRRSRRRRLHDRTLAESTSTPAPDENHVVLVRALAQLPEQQRRVIVLHHLADLSVAAVAVEVGAPVGTVKARLSRGRAALAELLSDDTPGGVNHA